MENYGNEDTEGSGNLQSAPNLQFGKQMAVAVAGQASVGFREAH